MFEQLPDHFLPLWGICEYDGNRCIAAAFPYRLPEENYAGRNVSRYAVVRDYHAVCGARLERACRALRELYPGKAFEWRCDNSSLPEAALAERAGLGYRGRHNLLITPAYGSWVFLGIIIAKGLVLPPDPCPLIPDPCDDCPGYCVTACPTGALSSSGFDKTRCVSYISQRKGALPQEEAALLRQIGTAWGCDICQEACPRNQKSRISPLPEFLIDPIAHVTNETPLEGRAYAWRGKAVMQRNISALEETLHGWV